MFIQTNFAFLVAEVPFFKSRFIRPECQEGSEGPKTSSCSIARHIANARVLHCRKKTSISNIMTWNCWHLISNSHEVLNKTEKLAWIEYSLNF